MTALAHAIDGLLGYGSTPDSPVLEADGLLVTCSGATWEGGRLRLDLHLAWRLPGPEAAAFTRLDEAFFLVLEDAATGAAAAMVTIDPHKKYPARPPGPNWRGPPPPAPPPASPPAGPVEDPLPDDQEEAADAAAAAAVDAAEVAAADEEGEAAEPPGEGPSLTGFRGGYVEVPLALGVAPADWAGPSVFVTARLHGLASNTLALEHDRRGVQVSSFVESQPWDPPRQGAATPAPAPRPAPPKRPALVLAPVTGGPPTRLEATLRVGAGELAAGGQEGWLRSVAVCAVLRGPEVGWAASWSGGRVLLDDDLPLTPQGAEGRLPVDLATIFGRRLPPGTYDVQVSARQHRSALLEVTIP